MSASRSTTSRSPSPWAVAALSFAAGGLLVAGTVLVLDGNDATATEASTTTATTQPTSTTEPQNVASYGEEPPGAWDIVGAGEGTVVEMRAEPGSSDVVAALPFDSVALASTGRVAIAEGVLWREVASRDASTGWLRADLLAPADVSPPVAQTGLPDRASAMVDQIRDAAEAGDLDTLAEIALDGAFTASFGSELTTAGELVAFWEEIGREEVLDTILALIGLSDWYETEARDGEDQVVAIFVTPRFMHEPANAENRRLLEEALGVEYVESAVADGQYLGWRLGVTEDGDWQFFVAGD